MNGTDPIKALIIEDDPSDEELLRETLAMSSVRIDVTHAVNLNSACEHLESGEFDIVISDLGLPDSCGIETLLSVKEHAGETPVIVLSGLSDEDLAVRSVREGAQDYLVKGSFDVNLLIRSILYSIERKKLMIQFESSLREIRTLKGLIPICSWCRKLRDDDGYWKLVETYLMERTDAAFTHGICPECAEKARIELEDAGSRQDGNSS